MAKNNPELLDNKGIIMENMNAMTLLHVIM